MSEIHKFIENHNMASQIDWSKFSCKVYIQASPQQVYDMWSTRANLERWFLRKAEFISPDGKILDSNVAINAGDTYEWMWHGYPDSTMEHGEVTEANGKDRFQFQFGNAGLVTVSVIDHGDVTEMLLTQENIPTDEAGMFNYHVGCSTGWTFYLANIKSILEGGLDLRNKNPAYCNVVNA